ncbi:MAG: PEGA domain-containing protein [Patescibacteria group bacterium]
MTWQNLKPLLIPFGTVLLILTVSFAIISYGRGYRLDITKKSVRPTGLMVAASEPTGAQVFIDGKIAGATNSTLNLSPGWYQVRILKEGYQPWEKRLRVQGEVVSKADAFLLPANPSLSAITMNGAAQPLLSPDGGKLAYLVPNGTDELEDKAGVWTLDLVDKPLGLNRDAKQIVKANALGIPIAKAMLQWSPDSKQILVTATSGRPAYLLDSDKLNEGPQLAPDPQAITKKWKIAESTKEKEKLSTLNPDLVGSITRAGRVINFSPDETKILYEATVSAAIPTIIKPPLIGTNPTEEDRNLKPGSTYIYDIKEDRNYSIKDINASSSHWLPTSRHLLLVAKEKIEVLEFDGTNRRIVYAGPFWDSFAVPWTSPTKIVILTSLNPAAGSIANLYTVNLR